MGARSKVGLVSDPKCGTVAGEDRISLKQFRVYHMKALGIRRGQNERLQRGHRKGGHRRIGRALFSRYGDLKREWRSKFLSGMPIYVKFYRLARQVKRQVRPDGEFLAAAHCH